jgi:two-component system sensor histidine kinase DctS
MENSVTIGLRAWTLDGELLYVNQAFCRMVGYSASELIGRKAPLPYWPAQEIDELSALHRRIIDRGTEQQGVEVQFQHRNGHRVDVLIHEAPLYTGHGQQIGWMSSVLDISEHKRAQRLAAQRQDRLETSGRLVAMGEVASNLAHELNQPLGALSSFAHGLLNRLQAHTIGLDELQPVVERMARLADKAGTIIQRVNAFARKRELVRQPLDLGEFMRQALAPHRRAPWMKPPKLAAPRAMWTLADALLLEHVVSNLIGNASHWAAQGPHPAAAVQVDMDVDPQAQMGGIHIGDNGPGVVPEHREHIFNAFFSTKEGGMGMGLAICRSIVEAHQGRIDVSTDPTLGGARFSVWLPLIAPPQSTP